MKAYIAENKQRFLDELFDFLRIPSISADSNHKGDMLTAAQFVEQNCKKRAWIKPKFVQLTVIR